MGGWALDETDPSSKSEAEVNVAADDYRSGGYQDYNTASANDDAAASDSPASCQNNCFGHTTSGIVVRLYCVSGSRRLSMAERALRGEVANIKCSICNGDSCNEASAATAQVNTASVACVSQVVAIIALLQAAVAMAAH